MGNYKFRLSDMIPNAWFYKLKDMGNKPKSKARTYSTSKKPISSSSKPKPPPPPQQPQQFVQHRNSYYFNTTDPFRSSDKLYNSPVNPKVTDVHFPDPPRKSSRKKSRRKHKPINPNLKPVRTCSVSAGCGCRDTLDSVWAKTDSTTPDSSNPPSPESNFHQSISPAFDINDSHPSWSTSSCSCRVSSSATDIIIDVDSTTTTTTTSNKSKFDCLDPISELELPPIVTKPVQFNETVSNNKTRQVEVAMETKKVGLRRINSDKPEQKVDEKVKKKISPRCSAVSPGVKIRANSPRIANKKIQAYSSRKTTMSTAVSTKKISLTRRKRVAESFAIVKSSIDPQSDFRESMVEMIVENNIRASKDLEELLACYLSLNSNEYHDLIIKAFEQIWFDLTEIPL